MISHLTTPGYKESLPGIRQKTLVYGDHTLMVEFRLDKDSDLPKHTHPYEQTGDLVSGHITLRIDAEESEIRPGDSWTIAGNAEHSAKIHQDSVAVEVFFPSGKSTCREPFFLNKNGLIILILKDSPFKLKLNSRRKYLTIKIEHSKNYGVSVS
jgi:quercetin dioxygenase-like cupin family protein